MASYRGRFRWVSFRCKRAFPCQLDSRTGLVGRASSTCGQRCPEGRSGRQFRPLTLVRTASGPAKVGQHLVRAGPCPGGGWGFVQGRLLEANRLLIERQELSRALLLRILTAVAPIHISANLRLLIFKLSATSIPLRAIRPTARTG